MKIGIIGAGNIGSTLGKKWAAAGHAVAFGARDPDDPKHAALKSIGRVVSLDQAVEYGEVIVLAQPGSAVPEFVVLYGSALAGKVVIDTTNNVRSPEMSSLAVLAENAPKAHLARAFSTLGWENFANPQLDGQQIDLFYCAEDGSQPVVETLITAVGLRPVYVGDLSNIQALDGLTRLWFALAFGQARGRRVALKLLSE